MAQSIEQLPNESYSSTGERMKLSQVLFDRQPRYFSSMTLVQSNIRAVEAGLLFAIGLHPFVVLVGPSGWGKSHLLESVANRIGAHEPTPKVVNAGDWAIGASKTDPAGPLLLDNLQEALAMTRVRQALHLGLERRIKSGRRTIVALTASSPKLKRGLLPFSQEWVVGAISAPQPAERLQILEQLAKDEGVHLSPQLSKLLSFRIHGNGRTLVGALKRLKLDGIRWTQPENFIRACGVLDMFFADDGDWDLREAIFRATQDIVPLPPSSEATDLAIFLMLREASLPEGAVARFFSIEPGEVYTRANRYETRSKGSAEFIGLKSAAIDNMIRGFALDDR